MRNRKIDAFMEKLRERLIVCELIERIGPFRHYRAKGPGGVALFILNEFPDGGFSVYHDSPWSEMGYDIELIARGGMQNRHLWRREDAS